MNELVHAKIQLRQKWGGSVINIIQRINNMKCISHYIAFAIVSLIIYSSTIINVSAQEENGRPQWYNGGPYNPYLEDTPGGNTINFLANKKPAWLSAKRACKGGIIMKKIVYCFALHELNNK